MQTKNPFSIQIYKLKKNTCVPKELRKIDLKSRKHLPTVTELVKCLSLQFSFLFLLEFKHIFLASTLYCPLLGLCFHVYQLESFFTV